MEILESRKKVCLFYKEHTGIDITAYGNTVALLFEGLYYRKAPITYHRLLQKMEENGLKFSYSALDRTRYRALCQKVKPEPCRLTAKGARFWYLSQQREFTSEEVDFMLGYDSVMTENRYPNIKSFLERQGKKVYRLSGNAKNSRAKASSRK